MSLNFLFILRFFFLSWILHSRLLSVRFTFYCNRWKPWSVKLINSTFQFINVLKEENVLANKKKEEERNSLLIYHKDIILSQKWSTYSHDQCHQIMVLFLFSPKLMLGLSFFLHFCDSYFYIFGSLNFLYAESYFCLR